ncbi:MAG: cytochrome c nitrite reductase small subunit [Leptospiraceae bacterium]|nr:cytochrome c nitrite reductase small subunit [Leptospiraceae bacterium]
MLIHQRIKVKFFLPTAVLMLGFAIGIGMFGIYSAKGHSYLMDEPASCANCHVMQEQYNSYLKSSHSKAAVCNDCHTPLGFVPKYFTKAVNGYNHSVAFTSGNFDDPIQITKRNKQIAEASCLKCHSSLFINQPGKSEPSNCLSCHQNIGH